MLQENEDQVIVIDDVTADCFEFLRQYFYCLNPVITVENVSYILYAAKKLKISSLIEATQEFILAVKPVGQGVDDLLLILSILHALTLRDMCNQVILANKLNEDAAKVFHSRNLNMLPTELMIRVKCCPLYKLNGNWNLFISVVMYMYSCCNKPRSKTSN